MRFLSQDMVGSVDACKSIHSF